MVSSNRLHPDDSSSLTGFAGTLAIIAGADTTASGVASLLYFLMRNKSCMSRVQEEIEHVYPDADDPLDSSKHGDLKYLNACM